MLRKPPSTNIFENYIRQYCLQEKITIETLAKRADIARGTFYNMIKPDSDPKIKLFISLANVMKVHPQVLLQLKWHEFDLSYLNAGKAIFAEGCEQIEEMSGFVDETIPDGTIITAGSNFTKTWTIQNISNQVWHGRSLKCIDNFINDFPYEKNQYDHRLTPQQDIIRLPDVAPYAQIMIPVFFKAPEIAGRYISYWKMVDENGEYCFPDKTGLYVSILVKDMGMGQIVDDEEPAE